MTTIRIVGCRDHKKASERYVDVVFSYPGGTSWTGAIPIEYRRTGTDLRTKEEVDEHIVKAYEHCNPKNWDKWRAEQEKFWSKEKTGASVTKEFFDILTSFEWCCNRCDLPANANPQRRIQDIKEAGYTLATDRRTCRKCGKSTTHHQLVPLPRGGISGYEAWDPNVRARIVDVLGRHDIYEDTDVNPHGLLPDHKFPEIRWDENTRRESLADLTEADIRRDFQLLTNQRNQQKREVCRQCSQAGKRGYPFGVKYYYAGTEDWPKQTPTKGKAAEKGCVGCGWYDLATWRAELNRLLQNRSGSGR